MKMNRNIINRVLVVSALAQTSACVAVDNVDGGRSVSPLLTTERWWGLNGYPGGISLRIATSGDADLLLKHNNAEIVYGYRGGDKQLRTVNMDTWNNASGEVVDCNLQVGKDPSRILIDRETNTLSIDGKEVNGIKGRVHLRYQFTSKGDKFAVLSADGARAPSIMQFLGQGGASGRHYNQVFTYPGFSPIGSPIELPFTSERVTFGNCWSSDERFVVYSDSLNFEMAIVVLK